METGRVDPLPFLSEGVENFAPNYGGIRSLFTEIVDVIFARPISRCILKLGEVFYFLVVHQKHLESLAVHFTFSQPTWIATE